jgi:hypothetical protein
MEDIPKPSESTELVSFEESLRIARDLFDRHAKELAEFQVPDNQLLTEREREATKFGRSSIKHYLSKFPPEVLERFSGHGVFRGDPEKNLAILINILQNQTIKGDSARLVNSGYYDAGKDGDVLLLSHIDQALGIHDEEGNQISNSIGWKADIGAYVVNSRLYPVIDDLRAFFPTANIIKANELPNYIDHEIER